MREAQCVRVVGCIRQMRRRLSGKAEVADQVGQSRLLCAEQEHGTQGQDDLAG